MSGHTDTWALGLVFDAGRTMRTIAHVTDTVASAVRRRFGRDAPPVTLVSGPPDRGRALFDLHLPDLHGIRVRVGASGVEIRWADVVAIAHSSGLARALRDMARDAERHHHDPALIALAGRLDTLDATQRTRLFHRFIARIESDPRLASLGPTRRTENVEQVMLAVGLALTETMRELGLTDEHIRRLAVITEELARPLVALTESYTSPRSWGDKLHRVWRLHLIGLRVLWILLRSAPGLARRQDGSDLRGARL